MSTSPQQPHLSLVAGLVPILGQPQLAVAPAVAAPQQQQQLREQQPSPQDPLISNKARNRSWDENYAELLTYKATHNGSTDVPLTYKHDRILGKWVAHLREHQNQAALSQERRDALNAIGFNWNPHEQKWNEMYDRLVDYKASTGHCKVPTNWKGNRKLGKWVMRQREKRKNNLLPDIRLQKLESIGFVWKIYSEPKTRKSTIIDERWTQRYEELQEFAEVHNHVNVPKDYGPLGKWVQEQRVMHQRKLLKQERKTMLEDIGFVFSYRAQKCQQDWNQMYELLKACSTYTEDGQFKVLGVDPGLARWVHRQKEAYRYHRLDPGREHLLAKINFQFPERAPLKAEPEGNPGTRVAFSTAAATNNSFPPSGEAVAGPAGGGNPKQDVALSITESEKQIGRQLAQGIEVLARYMSITPMELSDRLALQKQPEPSLPAPVLPALRESPRKKGAKKTPQLPIQSSPTAPPAPAPAPAPSKDVNAFGRLLPHILALLDNYPEEVCMTEAVRCLENFIRQEKGWDPRPSEGNTYNRLLSLAAELGVLLDPASERCRSIIATAEFKMEHILKKQRKEKKRLAETEDPPVDINESDSEQYEVDEEVSEPATKKLKVGETPTDDKDRTI